MQKCKNKCETLFTIHFANKKVPRYYIEIKTRAIRLNGDNVCAWLISGVHASDFIQFLL